MHIPYKCIACTIFTGQNTFTVRPACKVTSTCTYVLRVNFITHTYFFRISISVYYALASTRKDFTHRLVSETSIFGLDLSAATRIYAKKGLAVICVFISSHNALDCWSF